MSNKVPTISSSVLTAAPGGYYLDVWVASDAAQDQANGSQRMERFRFDSVGQMTDHSTESRRIALLAAGFEEHTLEADDVKEGDLIPSIVGGRVDSVDNEKKYKDIVQESDLDEMVKWKHFSFAGSEAILSIPASEKLTVLRKVQ